VSGVTATRRSWARRVTRQAGNSVPHLAATTRLCKGKDGFSRPWPDHAEGSPSEWREKIARRSFIAAISQTLDQLHAAAAKADGKTYFGFILRWT
jgi:hypothetical protein